jgi:hypothetical protein
MQDTYIGSAKDPTQSTDKGMSEQVNDNMKSPNKKKTKKSKTTKDDKKRNATVAVRALKRALTHLRACTHPQPR